MDATFTSEAVFSSQSLSVLAECWHERKTSFAAVSLYFLFIPGVHRILCETGPQQMLPTPPMLDVVLAAVL